MTENTAKRVWFRKGGIRYTDSEKRFQKQIKNIPSIYFESALAFMFGNRMVDYKRLVLYPFRIRYVLSDSLDGCRCKRISDVSLAPDLTGKNFYSGDCPYTFAYFVSKGWKNACGFHTNVWENQKKNREEKEKRQRRAIGKKGFRWKIILSKSNYPYRIKSTWQNKNYGV